MKASMSMLRRRDQPADAVFVVNSGHDLVAREGRMHAGVRREAVTDFPHDDDVRILPDHVAQRSSGVRPIFGEREHGVMPR